MLMHLFIPLKYKLGPVYGYLIFQQKAVDHCHRSLHSRHDNASENWLTEQLNTSKSKLKSLQDCLLGTLQVRLLNEGEKQVSLYFLTIYIHL